MLRHKLSTAFRDPGDIDRLTVYKWPGQKVGRTPLERCPALADLT